MKEKHDEIQLIFSRIKLCGALCEQTYRFQFRRKTKDGYKRIAVIRETVTKDGKLAELSISRYTCTSDGRKHVREVVKNVRTGKFPKTNNMTTDTLNWLKVFEIDQMEEMCISFAVDR
jgi:hypothetical protein